MDYLKYRFGFIILSVIIIGIGLYMGFTGGFIFDIDFIGGTRIQAELNEEFDLNNVSELIEEITSQKPMVQELSSGNNSVSITTNPITEEQSNKIIEKLKTEYENMGEPSIKNVQPSYGKDLINSSILALSLAIVIILVYIFIRFRALGISAAITAIIALIHDVLIMVSVYGIFRLPINSIFVAVLLTIIGYSINDTIIIYDRIRENTRKIGATKDLKNTINTSLNQTIKRTIYTSITTLTCVLVMYIFATYYNQQVLKDFSMPLIVGVISGTYSSIFIASSLWYMFKKQK